MLTPQARRAILMEIHRSIEEQSARVAAHVGPAAAELDLAYPPGVVLEGAERGALIALDLKPEAKAGLAKAVADACSSVIFRLFTVMDAVGDPTGWDGDVWLGATLEEPSESDEDTLMLHDEFFETYRNYRSA